jgi:hypothetical protein
MESDSINSEQGFSEPKQASEEPEKSGFRSDARRGWKIDGLLKEDILSKINDAYSELNKLPPLFPVEDTNTKSFAESGSSAPRSSKGFSTPSSIGFVAPKPVGAPTPTSQV